MINQNNYFEHIERIGFENLPMPLKQSHLVLMTKTDNGRDWKRFSDNKDFQQMRDLAFEKLGEFIQSRYNLSGMDKELNGVTDKKKDYSNIYEEIKIIERFLSFHDKILYKNTFKIFIQNIQDSITQKKLRKDSPVADIIMEIQEACINAYNKMNTATYFVIKSSTINRLKGTIVKFENDSSKNDKPLEPLKFDKMNLSGLENIKPAEKSKENVEILCSTDFSEMEFPSIGFKSKWLELIGDPAPGFTAMVYGLPKMGKSYLCIDFAVYLAEHHGKVLYVAAEEKIDATLQKKVSDLKASNPNLFFSSSLPDNLSAYDFIFLDSVSSLKLNIDALKKLKNDNPKKSFIFVFQSTKDGNFRGGNEFQHEVDVVISIPEKGKAVQFGRFNQGGELQFFGNESLEGISATKREKARRKGLGAKLEGKSAITVRDVYFLSQLGHLYRQKEDKKIYKALKENPSIAEKFVKQNCEEFMREVVELDIEVKLVVFKEIDKHGNAYFNVVLRGDFDDLRKIAGYKKPYFYQW